jgi:hypothetical protein
MSSVIHWVVDETHFRFIVFLGGQTFAVGALVAVALRFASGAGLDPGRNFRNNR